MISAKAYILNKCY